MWGNVIMESEMKVNVKNRVTLVIVTISIIAAVLGIIGIGRESIKTREWKNIPVISRRIKLYEDHGLNESERRILSMLSDNSKLPNPSEGEENNTYEIYFNCLKKYLSNSAVDLSNTKANEISNLIIGRNKIALLEQEFNISKMSLDGRIVSQYIYEKIYQLCGLKLVINSNMDIEQITDESSNILYQKTNLSKNSLLQVDALVITLLCIVILLSIGVIITKKKNLFVKGGIIDGFDEKEYA